MRALLAPWLPSPSTASRREQLRAAGGALFGLLLTALIGLYLFPGGSIFLVAPMGPSSVLLFALPASPLAQPWSAIGGNVVSGLTGVICMRCFGDVLPVPLLCALAASTA